MGDSGSGKREAGFRRLRKRDGDGDGDGAAAGFASVWELHRAPHRDPTEIRSHLRHRRRPSLPPLTTGFLVISASAVPSPCAPPDSGYFPSASCARLGWETQEAGSGNGDGDGDGDGAAAGFASVWELHRAPHRDPTEIRSHLRHRRRPSLPPLTTGFLVISASAVPSPCAPPDSGYFPSASCARLGWETQEAGGGRREAGALTCREKWRAIINSSLKRLASSALKSRGIGGEAVERELRA
jgi:hypothetical protein